MKDSLLNWLLGVVESHPEGFGPETVAIMKTRLQQAVGEKLKDELLKEAMYREQFNANTVAGSMAKAALHPRTSSVGALGGAVLSGNEERLTY